MTPRSRVHEVFGVQCPSARQLEGTQIAVGYRIRIPGKRPNPFHNCVVTGCSKETVAVWGHTQIFSDRPTDQPTDGQPNGHICQSFYLSISQTIDQSTYKSLIKQSIKKSNWLTKTFVSNIKQIMDLLLFFSLFNRFLHEFSNKSINQLTNQTINQSTNQSIN